MKVPITSPVHTVPSSHPSHESRSVRRATPADAPALAGLAERTFRATFAAFNLPSNMDAHCAKAYGASIQSREIADPGTETFVYDEEGRLAGYAQLRWGPAPACVVAPKPAEIQRIYVDAQHHGKGIAHALMAELFAAAARGGADVVWLGVWQHNARAIAFYEKYGFARAGVHVFMVGDDPQDDWILCRAVASGSEPL